MEMIDNDRITEMILSNELGDTALRGFFTDASGQVWFDRRLTFEGMQQASATTLCATTGPSYTAVSGELARKYGYNGA